MSRKDKMLKPGKVEWYDSPWQIALRAIGIAVGSILVMFIAAMFVVPKLNDGQALTVMSGSMAPSINPGDVIVVRGLQPEQVCSEIQLGEIISYFPHENDPTLITHRVVDKIAGHYPDGTNCRLIPKGDANNTADDPISPVQVRGQLMYGVPYVGWANDWVARNNKTAAVGVLVIFGLYYFISGFKQPKQRVLYLPGTAKAAPLMDEADFLARMHELDLRERELRLDEAEANTQFGYQPPQWSG